MQAYQLATSKLCKSNCPVLTAVECVPECESACKADNKNNIGARNQGANNFGYDNNGDNNIGESLIGSSCFAPVAFTNADSICKPASRWHT
jgi:hypothetical protein